MSHLNSKEIEDFRQLILSTSPNVSIEVGREQVLEILERLLEVIHQRNLLISELVTLGYG